MKLLPAMPSTRTMLRAVAATLAASVAGVVLGGALTVRPDHMLVEHVRFEGHDEAGAAELRHLLDLRNGTRVWEVDAEALAARAASHPWVAHADVRVEWPDTVVVEVVERQAVAVLLADRALYLDADGEPFLGARAGDVDLPHLTGIDSRLAALHPDLPGMAVHDALWLLDQLERRGLGDRADVSEIHFSEVRGFTVHLGNTRLVFGHGDTPRQLDRLERLVRDQGVRLDEPTYVDLAPPTVAIVRPLAPAHGG